MSTDTQAFKLQVQAQWDRSAQAWNDHTLQINPKFLSLTVALNG